MMYSGLRRTLERQNEILNEVFPEVRDVAQTVLYRMALGAVENDADTFKRVLANAKILSLEDDGGEGRVVVDAHPEYEDSLKSMNMRVKEASYAVLLAACGNNMDEARYLNDIATLNMGNIFPAHDLARIAISHSVLQGRTY